MARSFIADNVFNEVRAGCRNLDIDCFATLGKLPQFALYRRKIEILRSRALMPGSWNQS
ncbi:hypothetical protein AX23_01140 [Brucella melitensis 548]|nr:hypothetical protein AX23_01140 [Brucella melitensis 548]